MSQPSSAQGSNDVGSLIRSVVIALTLLFLSSPAAAADLQPATHTKAVETVAVKAPDCVPSDLCEGVHCTIPQEHCEAALFVYDFAISHNYSPPPGYKGGGVYRNTNGLLPPGGDYLEYRIYTTPGSAERIVIDRNTDDAWFTGDHYASFEELERIFIA
jgi:hypothetical protein